jgi:hypothetical protein
MPDALYAFSALNALEWTRTTTPLGTGPQPAAYTIPPRGLNS